MTRYARAPSGTLHELLRPGGFLAPLLARREVAGLALDVHLREHDHVHVYCGLTRLADAGVARRGVRVTADARYQKQLCATGLFRLWNGDEPGFSDALDGYFRRVEVTSAFTTGEGIVQAKWAAVRSAPWTPFDREAVLGYSDAAAKMAGRTFPEVAAAKRELERAELVPPKGTRVGVEVDQLAVDREGRLVVIELKDASAKKRADVVYAPLQLLQYVHEWAVAYATVRKPLDTLIAARVRLGLSPSGMPELTRGLRPVVAFGSTTPEPEVRAQFEAVRTIVNRHLPAAASPIEVWALPRTGPISLD